MTTQCKKSVCGLCHLLSDVTRLSIVEMLAKENELCVMQMEKSLNMSQPAASHHVALLRRANIITLRREGRNNFYSLSKLGKSTIEWIRSAADFASKPLAQAA